MVAIYMCVMDRLTNEDGLATATTPVRRLTLSETLLSVQLTSTRHWNDDWRLKTTAGVTLKCPPWRPERENNGFDMSPSYSNISGPIKSLPIIGSPPEKSSPRPTIYQQNSVPPERRGKLYWGRDPIMRHRLTLHGTWQVALTVCV